MSDDVHGPATGGFRRAREALDTYDADRVLSEALADDLVNDLAGRGGRGGRRRRGGRAVRPPARTVPRAVGLRLLLGGAER